MPVEKKHTEMVEMEGQQSRRSIGRWYILGLICLMYLITYLDRVNISTAAPVISKEFGFDKITMGVIFSAFVWAYALFQVPGGWLSDRFGPRPVLTTIVAYWSVMTALTAAATGAVSFVVMRFLFGIGEAGAFPGATRSMQLWYPREERGLVQGLTHSASRLGAAIAPPLVVFLMTNWGWRSAFYVCGAIGLVWSIRCAYFTYVYCLWIFLSWLPSYLVEYRNFTLLKVGLLASLPLFAGVLGDTVGGVATDWLLKKTGNTKLARRSVAIVGLLGCCIFIVPAALTSDAYTAVYCLTASMFFLECTIGPSWAVPMDTGGKYSGTVSGMMNMAGNIGAGVWAFWLDPDQSVLDARGGSPHGGMAIRNA